MKNNHQKDDRPSVLVTIETGSLSTTSIELAVAIAASMQSRLHGLFIENEDLLRVASLPFTREISFTTAEERPTDFDRMQRSLQATASSFKKSIKQAAQASKIPWSFDYVRSTTREDATFSSSGFDYTVVARRISSRVSTRLHRSVRRILVIEDHSPKLAHALEVVLHRFEQYSVEVTKVDAPTTDAPENKLLERFLDKIKSHISLVEFKREQLSDLLVTNAGCYDCAIVSADEDPDCQRELLDNLQCPLILVS